MARKFRERFKTLENVFDEFTFRNLFLLSSRGHFDEGSLSPLSIGKEANVFTAERDGGPVVVKIYRLETSNFKKMFEYIKQDPRYVSLARRKREIIFAWTQREYRNLLLARKAQVRAPLPLAFMKNILVMSLVGDGSPAHKMKDDVPGSPSVFLEGIVSEMGRFCRAGFVHGDLSKFNILNWNQRPVLIDFSQASPLKAPNALQMLGRDVRNVSDFFRRLGVEADEDGILRRIVSEGKIEE